MLLNSIKGDVSHSLYNPISIYITGSTSFIFLNNITRSIAGVSSHLGIVQNNSQQLNSHFNVCDKINILTYIYVINKKRSFVSGGLRLWMNF